MYWADLLELGREHREQSPETLADVMEAVNLKRVQNLRIRSVLARATSSLMLIATGGSVGREGPIVYMSASFGSALARLGRFTGPRMGLFAGCGVAAGMSAAYYALSRPEVGGLALDPDAHLSRRRPATSRRRRSPPW